MIIGYLLSREFWVQKYKVNFLFDKIAIEKLKKKAVANMIMLGYLQEKTKTVSFNAIEKAIADLVPPKTIDLI